MLKIENLKGFKIILFGAGSGAKPVLNYIYENGGEIAYFVDNNRKITSYEYKYAGESYVFAVNTPEAMLREDSSNIKILITADFPSYREIETQILEMGLGECLCPTVEVSCRFVHKFLLFRGNLSFCCYGTGLLQSSRPEFPFLNTAEETITNFLQNKEALINVFKNKPEKISKSNIAKPCLHCEHLQNVNYLLYDDKIQKIRINSLPNICQAKCIYCPSHILRTQSDYEAAKQSCQPEMILEMIRHLDKNNFLAEDFSFDLVTGEITIHPKKELFLDGLEKYKGIFFTNAYLFEPKIADSMKKNGSSIFMSLDSGTRETFQLVKGADLFEKVIHNLKKYREHGVICIKYIVMPGINDGDADIDGITDILKSLRPAKLILSFDYRAPYRAAVYSIYKFIEKLNKNKIRFKLKKFYTASQIQSFIAKYERLNLRENLEQRNLHLREMFRNKPISDIGAYREYQCVMEFRDLFENFRDGTRFTGFNISKNKHIVPALKKSGILLQIAELPRKEAGNMLMESTDIFIAYGGRQFNIIKSYIESAGENSRGRILDVGKFFCSFEPVKSFLESSIAKEYFKDGMVENKR